MVDKVLTRGRQMAVDNWSTTVDKVDKWGSKVVPSTPTTLERQQVVASAGCRVRGAAHDEDRRREPVDGRGDGCVG